MVMQRQERELREQSLILRDEWVKRQESDPLKVFVPFTAQRQFLNSVLTRKYKENYYIGANRSGKSDAGACAGATLARFGYEDARFVGGKGSSIQVKDTATSGWVSAVDFPTSRDTIQPKYFNNGFVPPSQTNEPFIPEREIADWRVSDQILKLKNGSIIGFKSADSGRIKYQGAEKDWVHLDEEHSKSIYEEIIIRVGSKPLNIFTTCTLLPPEGQVGGVTWIYNEIIKPWKQGLLENVGIFNASIYDNPHIPEEEIRKLEASFPEGTAARRIRLNGELIGGLSGARIYAGFDQRLNVRKQPDIALRRPLAWIWDFNVEPMISLIGQRERNIFRVFKELIIEEGNIGEMCDMFRMAHPRHLAEVWIYGDARGKDRSHQTKQTSYQLILNNMKDYCVPMRLKVPEKNPPIVSRINSVNRASKTEKGEIELEVDILCSELIDDMEQVLSDGRGGIKKTFNKKDPYYRRTHTSDALGYWIAQEAPVIPLSVQYQRSPTRIRGPGYKKPMAYPGS